MLDYQKIQANFKKNNMECLFVKDKEALFDLLGSMLSKDSSTGSGDSVTLEDIGVFEYLENKTIFNNKHQQGLSKEEKRNIYLKNFDVDFFFTGTNAITVNGEIFNIDGNGSRVAPMLYGPRRVIIIVGVNKIVETLDDAIQRSRQVAAVLDAKRLEKNTPCIKLNYCIDCNSDERICNDYVLIKRQFDKDRIKVIIVDDNLGY